MGKELDRMYVNCRSLDAARCCASGECVSAAVSLSMAINQGNEGVPSTLVHPLKEWEKEIEFGCFLHVTCQVAIGHAKGDARFSRPRRAWGGVGRFKRRSRVCIVILRSC
jgi:hypothetical protein